MYSINRRCRHCGKRNTSYAVCIAGSVLGPFILVGMKRLRGLAAEGDMLSCWLSFSSSFQADILPGRLPCGGVSALGFRRNFGRIVRCFLRYFDCDPVPKDSGNPSFPFSPHVFRHQSAALPVTKTSGAYFLIFRRKTHYSDRSFGTRLVFFSRHSAFRILQTFEISQCISGDPCLY
jgi:hypothetical protein